MSTLKQNPYIGPRTFESTESHLFFGREREALDLLSLVISERLVLFYAQSGAGKSSLINTKLIPGLYAEEEYKVLPVGRVGGGENLSGSNYDNIFVYNLVTSIFEHNVQQGVLAKLTIPEFVSSLENIKDRAWKQVLVIDQFEELFSTHQEHWEKREDFFRQLAQAISNYPNLWVVLVMREDYIAYLDPYVNLLPGRLRVRYYMQRLEHAAALKAIKNPVETLRPFAEGVAEKLVDDLSSIKTQKPDGTTITQPGQFVEPVQLQVVCYNLWESLSSNGDHITDENIQEVGDVSQSLEKHYANRVRDVAEKKKVSERAIREWFEKKLITTGGMRNIVMQEIPQRDGELADDVIQALQSDLVRAEKRGQTTFYELTHDRLVEPILINNKKWENEHIGLLQRGASLWDERGRSDGLLLRGNELRDAETWAKANSGQLSSIERTYLAACLKARADSQERVRINLRLRKNLSISVMISFVAIFFVGIASVFGFQSYIANRQAKAQELAAQSENARENGDTKTATILAYQALKNYPYTGEAEEALGKAVSPIDKPISISSLDGKILDISLSSRNGFILAAINDRGLIQYWNANTGKPLKTVLINGLITYAVFSFDGSKLLTRGKPDPSTLTSLWDTANGKELAVLDDPSDSADFSANFSPNDSRVATSSYLESHLRTRIWDTTHGKLLSTFPPGGGIFDNRSLSFNRDGSRMVNFQYTEIGIWDTTTSKELFSLGNGPFVAFSPDGRRVATFTDNHDAMIWDANTGRKLTTILFSHELVSGPPANLSLSSSTFNLVFNSDSSRIVVGISGSQIIGTNIVSVWDANSGKKLFTLSGNPGNITRAVFSPNGLYVATSSEDHTVRIWDIQNQGEIPASGARHNILTIKNNSDTKSSADNIIFSQDNSHVIILWDNGQIDSWEIPPSRLKLFALAEHKCGECKLSYEQRIEYDIHDWSMVVKDYGDFFFTLWVGCFYIILGWLTYRKVFSSGIASLSNFRGGFTWMRFLFASLITGTLLILFLAGVFFIMLPENSVDTWITTRSFGLSNSNFLLLALPILIWPGGIYCHLTRFQSGKWTRSKRIMLSVIAGMVGMVIVSIITLVSTFAIGVLIKNSEFVQLFAYLVVGALFGLILEVPLNLLGALIYTFGLQPLATKWKTKTMEEYDY